MCFMEQQWKTDSAFLVVVLATAVATMDTVHRRDCCLPMSPHVTPGILENTATSMLEETQFHQTVQRELGQFLPSIFRVAPDL